MQSRSTPGIEPGTSCMLDHPEAGIMPLDQVDSREYL